jgi:hypothetical protein
MTQRTLPTSRANAGTPWESYLVLVSVTVLSGLAVADRFAAWLIGKFPTSAGLWQLRFEYLRPIAVYYDLIERNFGRLSPSMFSALALLAAVLIAAGAVSPVRLARAMSYHVLLGAGATLVVLCFDSDLSIGPRALVGTPSESYCLFGAVLSSIAIVLCLRIHAEYIGWSADSSQLVRRIRISSARVSAHLQLAVNGIVEQLGIGSAEPRPVLIHQRTDRRDSQAQ